MVSGAAVSVLAAWGLIDFDTPLARMHAATKSASLGLALLTLGAAIVAGSWGLVGVAILVTAFLFLTAPISGHMLGRAAYAAGQVVTLVHDDLESRNPQPFHVPRSSTRRLSLLRLGLLVVVWVLLWRDASPGVWVAGLALATGSEIVRRASERRGRVSVAGMLRFLFVYAGRVVASNVRVAWEVVTPSNEQIREAIVAVPLATRSMSVALLVANVISYTPGSLTIELAEDPFILYVHVLHFESVDQVRTEVASLETLAMRALSEPIAPRM